MTPTETHKPGAPDASAEGTKTGADGRHNSANSTGGGNGWLRAASVGAVAAAAGGGLLYGVQADDGAASAIAVVTLLAVAAQVNTWRRGEPGEVEQAKRAVEKTASTQTESPEQQLIHSVNELKLQFEKERDEAKIACWLAGIAVVGAVVAAGLRLSGRLPTAGGALLELPVLEALLLGAGGWALTLHSRLHGRSQANLALLVELIELQLAVALVKAGEGDAVASRGGAGEAQPKPAELTAELLRALLVRRRPTQTAATSQP